MLSCKSSSTFKEMCNLSKEFFLQGVKKGLHTWRKYRTHLNEQKVPSQHMCKNQCLLRYRKVSVWVSVLGDKLLGPVVLHNRPTAAMYHRIWWMIYQYSGTHASLSVTTLVVHAWWGTTSFSLHCQIELEPHFQWTMDRMRRPSQLVYTIPWP
jgi:hypothetical protein